MNDRIQSISELDRLVHEPARLKILMILQGASEADFLYLQREGGFTQGNLSSPWPSWKRLDTWRSRRLSKARCR